MKTLLAFIILASNLFLSTVFASQFDQIKQSKILKIAVDTTYPPMEFEGDDGKPAGLDVELALEISKRLGFKAQFIIMPWDGILAGLQSKRYDIIMSSMNITPEREQQVNFVEYIKMGQVFVTKKNSPKINTEKDLAGKVIAVQADTTSYSAVEKFKKNGIPIKEIKAFKGATETFSALKANQAQVIVIDEAVGYYYSGLDSKSFIVTGEALKPEPIGIAINKSEAALAKVLAETITKMKSDGSFNAIYKKWLKTDYKK